MDVKMNLNEYVAAGFTDATFWVWSFEFKRFEFRTFWVWTIVYTDLSFSKKAR